MKPVVRTGRRRDSLLVLTVLCFPEKFPCEVGMTDILNGMDLSDRIFRLEIERTEINHVVRDGVDRVEYNSGKCLLKTVVSADVHFNGALGEDHIFQPGNPENGY